MGSKTKLAWFKHVVQVMESEFEIGALRQTDLSSSTIVEAYETLGKLPTHIWDLMAHP